MPFLPLHDANPRRYIRAHYITIALIALNGLVFWNTFGLTSGSLDNTLIGYALVPARLFADAQLPGGWPGVSAGPAPVFFGFCCPPAGVFGLSSVLIWVSFVVQHLLK